VTFVTIVVCGGGCYGGYYVRQLARARAAGVLTVDRILVVDRSATCPVATLIAAIQRDDVAALGSLGWRMRRAEAVMAVAAEEEAGYRGLPIEFVESDWAPFFASWFQSAIKAPELALRDAVVPSPLMPHLLSDWVETRIAAHRPSAGSARVPMTATMTTPWLREATDLAVYASFATWMCPINCIEPPRCPETRGPRDWTMPAAVQRAVDDAEARGWHYHIVALFQTTHRLYGVGMFDVSAAVRTDTQIAANAALESLVILVASVSHCHGALAEIVSTRYGPGSSPAAPIGGTAPASLP
jgi:hypothetical protein